VVKKLVATAIAAVGIFGGLLAADAILGSDPDPVQQAVMAPPTVTPTAMPSPTATATPTVTPLPTVAPPTATPTPTPYVGWVDPQGANPPWSDEVEGVLTFRGSPARTYYGEGPVPENVEVSWSYPDRPMCGWSSWEGELVEWCGVGWTGQPAVWERDGEVWVAFGAMDGAVHVLDGETGLPRFAPFKTGDLIKGTLTVDPDGRPLLYTGSRDNKLRILSFDGEELEQLWALDALSFGPRLWNNDWDAAPLIVNDYMFAGGENSNMHIIKLNRGTGDDGRATVDPELLHVDPSWDDELMATINDTEVSVENSLVIRGTTMWFANSSGLVQGWDIADVEEGGAPERIFRFWVGEDVDATLMFDDDGFLYVAAQYEKKRARAREVGQLLKVDVSDLEDPLVVWSIEDQLAGPDSGFWATPALWGDMIYASTQTGRLMGVDRISGEIVWEKNFERFLWGSPIVVDDVLIQGDCDAGIVRGWDVSDPTVDPPELWAVQIGGCIEATPVVWRGHVYIGSRNGYMYRLSSADGVTESASG